MAESEPELLQEEASDPRHGGFLFNVNLIFLSTVAVNVISFLAVVVIARLLGAEGRGITALYQTGINFVYAFISFGVAVGALYYVSRHEVTTRQALEAGLTATLASAVLSAAGVGLLWLFADDALSDAGVPYWLAIVAIPLVVQFRLVEVLIRADGRFAVVSVLEAAIPALMLGGMLAVEAVDGLTIGWAILISSFSPLPSVIAGYIALGPATWPRGFEAGTVLRRLVTFGLQGQAGNILQTLNYRLDSFLLLFFVNSTGVGLYAVGVSLSEGLLLLANAVAIVLIPKLAASDASYAARTTPLICRNTVLVTALGAAVLAVLSPVLVPLLFGEEFEAAVTPLLWLLPGIVALSGTKVLAAYIFSQGAPMRNTWISLVTLVVTIGFDFLLIPLFDVTGAAISSTLAYVTSLVLTLIAYRKMSGGSTLEAIVPRPADIGLAVEGARGLLARFRAGRGVGLQSG